MLNPRAGLVRNVERGLGFKVLYGQAFKAPSVFEQFDGFRGNEDLDPEEIATVEVEVNYRHGDRAYLWGGFFFTNMTDLIIVAPNPDPTKVPIGPISQHLNYFQNIGSTDVSGLVLGADVQLGKSAFGYANYSLTRDGDGDEIDNISQHKMNAGVNLRAHRHVNANLRAN